MGRPYIYNIVRRRGSSLVFLKEAFRAGGENTRTWNMIMRALLEKDKVHQCFYWIPVNSGFAVLVGFHILRSVLVSNRYLLTVAVGLQTAIRALQTLKDS